MPCTVTHLMKSLTVPPRRAGSAERIKQDDVIYEVHKDKNYIIYATKEKLLRSLVDPRTGTLVIILMYYNHSNVKRRYGIYYSVSCNTYVAHNGNRVT